MVYEYKYIQHNTGIYGHPQTHAHTFIYLENNYKRHIWTCLC